MGQKKNLIDKRFGRLLVIKEIGIDAQNNVRWLCKCDCGKEKILTTAILNYGAVKSCGCLRNEKLINRSKKHGYSKRGRVHPLYSIRIAFINRCHNAKDRFYQDYGKRGIYVCEEWRQDPESFIKWALKNGWKPGLSIDRKNNDKGYSPENCRFVSQTEQSRNTRRTIYLTFNGKTRSLSDWADRMGLKARTLYSRIKVYNWSTEKALTTPLPKNDKTKEAIL